MSNCPCCSNKLLRHIRAHQIYWFCRHCWQEMPVIDMKKYTSEWESPLIPKLVCVINSDR
ncbi:MAG TPA: hypothetical protein DEG17_16845 [Cyanobacteria bacterium UBA11149]|nr:hypothetical protein [Cyanobacteria bacterium UBA11367]HBE58705.1 hypothetical protein [Cyanobacteria bacterium UBA11366]HBK66209.1 hypothetical protein [Cyanobacteria bacterium UBA11166]HBR74762.1 hypothetical protein [Cyanobacteria bacterium UBA11159]HBS72304.1 hypothetical protein [Cyanobacteria bacterium UBA11153]HBW90490.1 hypothetical protein [Cyanobacteria bacterium UBA11149]HCA93881.1 hypothetical protein [Cyanobacteria bacterium UBA9226]